MSNFQQHCFLSYDHLTKINLVKMSFLQFLLDFLKVFQFPGKVIMRREKETLNVLSSCDFRSIIYIDVG